MKINVESLCPEHWDGEGQLYSESREEFFASPSEALDGWLREQDGDDPQFYEVWTSTDLTEEQRGLAFLQLDLRLCKPVYFDKLDADNPIFLNDSMDDGYEWEPCGKVLEAIQAFNTAVEGVIRGWESTSVPMIYEEDGKVIYD